MGYGPPWDFDPMKVNIQPIAMGYVPPHEIYEAMNEFLNLYLQPLYRNPIAMRIHGVGTPP